MYGLEEESPEDPGASQPIRLPQNLQAFRLEEEAPDEPETPITPASDSHIDQRRQYKTTWQEQRRKNKTAEEDDRRRRLGSERERKRRHQETSEESELRHRAGVEREWRRHLHETLEESEHRHRTSAERERQRDLHETLEESEHRHQADVERKQERRLHETPEIREARRAEDALAHGQRRRHSSQRPESHGEALTFSNVFPEEDDLGPMNVVCKHCSALHFKGELAMRKTDEFAECCQTGKVQLPDLQPYPNELKQLLLGQDRSSQNFWDNIRSYNSALAFASLGAKLDIPSGRGPYCFKVHGQIYHRIGSLHPNTDQPPSYGQLYILDSAIALQERKSNKANEGCLDDTLQQLDQIIRKISPFAEAFQLMHEVEKAEIERADREKRDTLNYMMVFDIDRRLDRRRYNILRANEIAAIIVDEGGDGEVPSHEIAVHLREGQLRVIPVTSTECDPMVYPLLFPHGEMGWHPNMKNTQGERNISMLQFYSFRIAQWLNKFNPIVHSGKLFQQYLVDAYVKVEETRLNYQRYNQKQLRAESYRGLADYVATAANQQHIAPGRVVILASSFPGSP
uniref:Helitron helicase-like domain-containing protein n=1 Tax=Plectus sambesii TaxID=2011161 RepID=A0A914V163_9BILA